MKGIKIFVVRKPVLDWVNDNGPNNGKRVRMGPFSYMNYPWKKGEWSREEYPVLCRSGWHFITDPTGVGKWIESSCQWGKQPIEVWVVEGKGPFVHSEEVSYDPPKVAATSIRLLRQVGRLHTMCRSRAQGMTYYQTRQAKSDVWHERKLALIHKCEDLLMKFEKEGK